MIGNVSAMVLFISFAIDRVTRALLFVGTMFEGPWTPWLPDPLAVEDPAQRARAEKKQTMAYYVVASTLSLAALFAFHNVRLLKNLNYDANWFLDALLTGIVLIGGSDLVSKVLQVSGLGGGGSESKSQPLEITGKLILEDSAKKPERP